MDTEDQLLAKALLPMVEQIKAYVQGGRPLNRQTMHDIDEIVDYHSKLVRRRHGLNVPPLAAIVLHSVGHVQLVRADMDNHGLQIIFQNILTQFPGITIFETSHAIQSAFPDYRPSMLPGVRGLELAT